MKSFLVLASTILHLNPRFRGAAAFVTTMKRARDNGHRGGGRRQRRNMVSTPSNSATSPNASRIDMSNDNKAPAPPSSPPLYLEEGLLAVHKPLTWTSNDVVSYIRGILTRDAHGRGAKEENNNDGGGKKKKWGRRKKPMFKVGHGGTLDPLASGVLVIGVGSGTKFLQSYLEGSKRYAAVAELGYETDTLDAEGKLVKTAPWDHVKSIDEVREKIIPKFSGKIEQVPPLYSAVRIDGKRLYEIARKDDSGKAAESVEIPKREVEVFEIGVGTELEEEVILSGVVDGAKYREAVQAMEAAVAAAAAAAEAVKDAEAVKVEEATKGDAEAGGVEGNVKKEEESEDEGNRNKKRRRRNDKKGNKKKGNSKKCPFDETSVPSVQSEHGTLELPRFSVSLECGGGTYARSLVRDIGYELDTVATMTGLVRTKQGPFVLGDALRREDWTPEKIYEAIRRGREKGGTSE